MRKPAFSLILKVALLASTLVLDSCEDKDAEPVNADEMPVCQVTRIVTDDTERIFEYDAARQLIEFIGPYDDYLKFEYQDNRLTTLTSYYDNDESKVIDIDNIEYDSKGQWRTHTSLEDKDSAAYDEHGSRIKIINKRDNRIYTTYLFEYTAGNLSKQIQSYYADDGSLSYVANLTYEYDLTKENNLAHFQSLVPFGYASASRLGQEPTPSRQMVKSIRTEVESSPIRTASFQYEYNDQGFPLKITVFGEDLNGDGQQNSRDTLVYSYYYDCL